VGKLLLTLCVRLLD